MIILWVVSVGLFNRHDQMTTESDLWSWSCHHKDMESAHVNWGQFCIEQVFTSITKTGLTCAEMVFCLWNSGDHLRDIVADFVPPDLATSDIEEGIEESTTTISAREVV